MCSNKYVCVSYIQIYCVNKTDTVYYYLVFNVFIFHQNIIYTIIDSNFYEDVYISQKTRKEGTCRSPNSKIFLKSYDIQIHHNKPLYLACKIDNTLI